MTDIQTFNDPVFKLRLTYFQSERFFSRFDRLAQRLRRGERPDDSSFWEALECTEAELSAWLTILDTMDALAGREPRHGFPALRDRGHTAVDVRIAPNGDLLDYEFLEWAPEAAPAHQKETMQ